MHHHFMGVQPILVIIFIWCRTHSSDVFWWSVLILPLDLHFGSSVGCHSSLFCLASVLGSDLCIDFCSRGHIVGTLRIYSNSCCILLQEPAMNKNGRLKQSARRRTWGTRWRTVILGIRWKGTYLITIPLIHWQQLKL